MSGELTSSSFSAIWSRCDSEAARLILPEKTFAKKLTKKTLLSGTILHQTEQKLEGKKTHLKKVQLHVFTV